MRIAATLLCATTTSCFYGGGPVVGIGQHGFVAGAEVTGGYEDLLPRGTLGYQMRAHQIYARIDEGFGDELAINGTKSAYGFRGGVGLGWSTDTDAIGGVADFGFSKGRTVTPPGCDDRRGAPENWVTAVVVSLDLRYATEWQLVLAPRIERILATCSGGDGF